MNVATTQSTAVFVLGMHRSGTSSVAGVLQRFGVELGSNLLGPQPDNEKGFFERVEFMEIHNRILETLGTSWDDPASLPSGWDRDPRLTEFRGLLKTAIQREFGNSALWGVKDPRLCRLLPLWLDIVAELRVRTLAVLVIRDPLEVAASLRKRNALDVDHAVTLWVSHVVESERHTRSMPRVVLFYEDFLTNWQIEVERLRATLGLSLQASTPEVIADVTTFVDRDLRHHNEPSTLPALRAPQNTAAAAVFAALVDARRDGTISPEVFEQADQTLSYAERAALPFATYLRGRYTTALAAQAADEQARFEAQLVSERDAAAARERRTRDELAGETKLRVEAQTTLLLRRHSEMHNLQEAADRRKAYQVLESKLRAQAKEALGTKAALEAQLTAKAEQFDRTEAALRAMHVQLQRDVLELQELLRLVLESNSWRLTRPLRLLLSLPRKLLRRVKGS